MAYVSIELRDIVESGFNIFDFPYDFYDPAKKDNFEKTFVKHFKYREIGCETVGRFVDYLEDKMLTVFPMYNEKLITAQIQYEKTKNYNMLETTSKTANKVDTINVTGNQSGTNTENSNSTGSLSHTAHNSVEDSKTNTINSTSDHIENSELDRDEQLTEEIDLTKTDKKDIDLKKIHSKFPANLISLEKFENGFFADDAEIDDNTEDNVSTDTGTNTKESGIKEVNDKTAKDTVVGTTHDSGNSSINESGNDVSSNNVNTGGSFNANNTTNQNATGTETENVTHTMSGSYGVITEADMLQKHLALQEKLQNIYRDFFNECEDLFLQYYKYEGGNSSWLLN